MISQAQTLDTVRKAVRSVVRNTPELRGRPELQRVIATRMVDVSLAAAELLREEQRLSDQVADRVDARAAEAIDPSPPAGHGGPEAAPALAHAHGASNDLPLAAAQTASDIHGMSATRAAAGTLQATREAIDFPGFVTNLITGVFQAIQNSNIQQLEAFAELLGAVGGATEDFATSQVSASRAASWAVSQFGVFNMGRDGDAVTLELKDDADLPDTEVMSRLLDATEDEVDTIDDTDLVETLLPLVRRKLARDRQSMLSTMMLMGLQRVVVDDGALHASMRLQVDARSTAEQRQAEQFDSRVETEASGSFGMGAWGASAKMSASVGFVKSDEQFTREDIGVSAGLRSSVDLRFRTLPLDLTRMASNRQLQGLRDQSLVPSQENAIGPGGLLSGEQPQATREPSFAVPPGQGALLTRNAGTAARADTARREAAARQEQERARRAQGTQGQPARGATPPARTPPARTPPARTPPARTPPARPPPARTPPARAPTTNTDRSATPPADRNTTPGGNPPTPAAPTPPASSPGGAASRPDASAPSNTPAANNPNPSPPPTGQSLAVGSPLFSRRMARSRYR